MNRDAYIPENGFTITPNDDTVININAFRVGTTAGDVAVRTAAGQSIVIPNVQIGERIDLAIVKILSTNTTAVGITGFR